MKYIDADKLKAAIEKRLKNIRDYINGAGMKYKGPKFYKARGKESAYDELLSIIYFLQQEQPEQKMNFEVKFAEFLERKDAELGAKACSEEDLRELALYFYYSRNDDEQPKVELEEEVNRWKNKHGVVGMDDLWLKFARHFYGLRNSALDEAAQHVYESWMGGTMDDVRRDMVELGKVLNARKED